MGEKLKICMKCRNESNPPFFGYYPVNGNCPKCKTPMEEVNLPIDDFFVIKHTSQNVEFYEAMIKLHDEDIIEYESRMSQFRANDPWYQEKHGLSKQSLQESSINVPKCPHCNSTNIKPITTGERIGSITMLGIFSKKINKSFKCLDCKYTW